MSVMTSQQPPPPNMQMQQQQQQQHPPRMMGMMGGPRFPPPGQHFGGGGGGGDHHHPSSHSNMPRPRMGYQPYRLYPRPAHPQSGGADANMEYDGRRLRKSLVRKTVDYNAAIVRSLQNRVWQRDHRDRRHLEPDYSYAPDTVPPALHLDNPTNAVTTRYVKSATNKMRCPIFCMAWTPEGRRLVTGASSGEFTLWNGLTFNFETILQAHDSPVRSMIWSHNDIWMVTADHAGYVKYWQSNMNNVKMFQAHKEAVRGLTFSPSDQKFASCSDDGTIRVWDFYTCFEEKVLRGHGADVKCVDWHPHKGIIVSGSKDNQQPIKIWDPKAGISLCTIHAHKSTVMDARWNKNGNWLITASRDHLIKLFDIRKLSQEMQVFRGHKKEASCVSWHPIHESLFASGGSDGSIMFWNVGCEKEIGSIEAAHDNIIWTLAWHPVGHILCSGSNDHTSKFWTRQKPGDIIRDKGHGAFHDYSTMDDNEMEEAFIPGMGPEDKIETQEQEKEPEGELMIPGLDLSEEMSMKMEKPAVKKTPYQKPIPKKFQAIWNDTKVEEELDDEKGRNPLLPRPSEKTTSSGNAASRSEVPERESTTNSDGGNIFDPNIGFGPMGAQYNVPPPSMTNPFFLPPAPNILQQQQQPPPGPSPFLNPSGNPFWTPPMGMNPGPPKNPHDSSRQGQQGRSSSGSGPGRRGTGGRNTENKPSGNRTRGWNR